MAKRQHGGKEFKGNPKVGRIIKTLKRGKMAPEKKVVRGPLDELYRKRGNKAGKGRFYLPAGHISRCH